MFDLGDPVPLTFDVRDPAGALVDPTAVTVTITLPDATTTTGTLTLPSTPSGAVVVTRTALGRFAASPTSTQPGTHTARWTATGTNPQAYLDAYTVADTAGPIVSLGEVRTHLRKTSPASDEELRRYAVVATELAEEWLGYVLRRTVVTAEQHDGGREAVLLLRCPVQSVTTVTVEGATLPAADYRLDKTAGILHHASSRFGGGALDVEVTYVAAPARGGARYAQGVLEITRHLWDTQRGGSQLPRQQGAGDDWASESGWSVPRRVMELLGTRAPGIA